MLQLTCKRCAWGNVWCSLQIACAPCRRFHGPSHSPHSGNALGSYSWVWIWSCIFVLSFQCMICPFPKGVGALGELLLPLSSGLNTSMMIHTTGCLCSTCQWCLPSCSKAKGVERVPAFFFPGSTVGDEDTFWTFREMSVDHIWMLNELQEILQYSAHSHSYQAAVTHFGTLQIDYQLSAYGTVNSLVVCIYR